MDRHPPDRGQVRRRQRRSRCHHDRRGRHLYRRLQRHRAAGGRDRPCGPDRAGAAGQAPRPGHHPHVSGAGRFPRGDPGPDLCPHGGCRHRLHRGDRGGGAGGLAERLAQVLPPAGNRQAAGRGALLAGVRHRPRQAGAGPRPCLRHRRPRDHQPVHGSAGRAGPGR